MRRLLLALTVFAGLSCAGEPVPPDAELDARAVESDGNRFAILDNGKAYVWDPKAKSWSFLKQMWDPEFFEKHYVVEGDEVFRTDDGQKVRVSRSFRADFEKGDSLRDLVGLEPGWTGFTLQSPKAKEVADYVKLRQRILKGEGRCLDNVLELSDKAHRGKRSLRCFSVACPKDMVCCKSSIETELIHFRKGDDFWFGGWFMAEGAVPFTIMDLETTWIEGHPGIRIMTSDDGLLFELKYPPKPKWRPAKKVPVPLGRWFRVVAHVRLHESDGVVEIWQDGQKVVEGKGQTMPIAGAIYNSLEVGISATVAESTLYVDDVEVTDREIR